MTKAEMVSADGHEIISTVSIAHVASGQEVLETAKAVHKKAMMRLACLSDLSAEDAKYQVIDLKSTEHPDSTLLFGSASVSAIVSGRLSVISVCPVEEVRKIVERSSMIGDIYFELFHQARTSSNAVVEFLGYYQIISSVLDEPEQKVIDEFFLSHGDHQPAVTPKPNRNPQLPPKGTETVYSRLRNEIAHVRIDPVTKAPLRIEDTKVEIAKHVAGLRRLAVVAIQQAIRSTT